MNHSNLFLFSKTLMATAIASLLLVGCSTAMTKPDGADAVRSKLTRLQSDAQLASRAPVAIKDAEAAVQAAEEPREDIELGNHLVLIADRKVDSAAAQAQSRLAEDQRKGLSEQREAARLDARTREADKAGMEAKSARFDAEVSRNQAATARKDADIARSQASSALSEAEFSRNQADSAALTAQTALQQSADLQRQIAELNARETERGLVVTLGDVLFASGRADLKGGTTANLTKLAAFLNKYQERSVIIEGHTDSVGSANTNQALSQRRADSVKSYIVSQGVGAVRIASSGMGEGSPVASNDSTTGRQQNRRVEVIISNKAATSAK